MDHAYTSTYLSSQSEDGIACDGVRYQRVCEQPCRARPPRGAPALPLLAPPEQCRVRRSALSGWGKPAVSGKLLEAAQSSKPKEEDSKDKEKREKPKGLAEQLLEQLDREDDDAKPSAVRRDA